MTFIMERVPIGTSILTRRIIQKTVFQLFNIQIEV